MVKLLSAGGRVSRSRSPWLVCAGATRDVRRGRVECPGLGTVAEADCLACHLLVAVADERNLRFACTSAE